MQLLLITSYSVISQRRLAAGEPLNRIPLDETIPRIVSPPLLIFEDDKRVPMSADIGKGLCPLTPQAFEKV